MITISVDGTDYEVPSSAADTNWAAKQVAFEQALAAVVDSDNALVANILSGSTTFAGTKTFSGNISAASVTAPSAAFATSALVGLLRIPGVDTTGTPGDALVTKPRGRSSIASGQTACVLTYVGVGPEDSCFVQLETPDGTGASRVTVAVTGDTITVTANAAATTDVVFSWFVVVNV